MATCEKILFCVAVCVGTLIPASFGQSCQEAETCLQKLQSLSPDMPCLKRLNQTSILTECIKKGSDACDSTKNKSLHDGLKNTLGDFCNNCTGSQECSNILDLYSGLMSECLVSDDHMTDMLNDAVNDWNRKGNNATVKNKVKSTVQCIEQKVRDSSLLRKAYGQIYQDYPQLGLLQQTLGIYKEINGDDPSSPIISDCDGDPSETLKEIINNCSLKIDRDEKDILIINYCVWMQEQIDCVLGWEKTCPVAVTKFLSPFMDSYSVTHLKFCNNITIHGLMFRPLNQNCDGTNYQRIYKECWSTFLKGFASSVDGSYYDITGNAMESLFRLSAITTHDKCSIFRDSQQYNPAEMRACARKHANECHLLFPTHGDPVPVPEGLRYDPDIYHQLQAGPTPFNEYGLVLLQYLRDRVCYPECDKYDELNADYKNNCQTTLRQLASQVRKGSKDHCMEMTKKITCASNVTMTCPLFQYDAQQLLNEPTINSSLTNCNITKPKLLPDDYYLSTTTRQPIRTTSYWMGSSKSGLDGTDGAVCLVMPSFTALLFAVFCHVILSHILT